MAGAGLGRVREGAGLGVFGRPSDLPDSFGSGIFPGIAGESKPRKALNHATFQGVFSFLWI